MDNDLPMKLAVFAGLIFCIVVHEVAHALVAYWLGDTTAKDLGRITLNPIPHIDPFMSILLPAVLLFTGAPVFGGAKPVPVNMLNFRRPFLDMCWTALAGPVSNVLLAVGFALLINFTPLLDRLNPQYADKFAVFLISMVFMNVLLAVFNMLPIPPLDGSRILAAVLPRRLGAWIYTYPAQSMGMVFIMLLVFMGGTTFLVYPRNLITKAILRFALFDVNLD